MLADSAKMQELEQRYIRLLEERCAKLEALLGEKSSETKVNALLSTFYINISKSNSLVSRSLKAFRSIKIPSYCYYFPQVHLRAVHGQPKPPQMSS